MIDQPPKSPTLRDAAEWVVRALRDEGFPILLCGRSAVDYLGEHTGSVDIDLLIGTDFKGANYVLGLYASRGDLFPAGGTTDGSVKRYLVSGWKAVDVMDVSAVDSRLFDILTEEASEPVHFGSAGEVRAVTREGYFLLAVLIGKRGFAREQRDPMAKVREAWALFGVRTKKAEVQRLLAKVGEPDALDQALELE